MSDTATSEVTSSDPIVVLVSELRALHARAAALAAEAERIRAEILGGQARIAEVKNQIAESAGLIEPTPPSTRDLVTAELAGGVVKHAKQIAKATGKSEGAVSG